MPRIHTHYDNLKVTRNAPPEVIRAAYKTLCQKFHPDRNPDNESAKKTFLLIRTAYETLSDPEKRRLHDAWIAAAEAPEKSQSITPNPTAKPKSHTRSNSPRKPSGRKNRVWQIVFWMTISSLILIGFFLD